MKYESGFFILHNSSFTLPSSYVLPERYPKPVEVADEELSHSVKGVMKAFHDLHSILKMAVKIVNIVDIEIQIDFPTALRARLPARVEHDLATSEREARKTKPVTTIVERVIYRESDALIPIDGRAHVGHMDHRYHSFRFHGFSSPVWLGS